MQLTNRYNLPTALVHAVENMMYDPRDRDPKRIGITTLISNPLPRMLTLKHYDELEEDVSDHLWRIAGSGMHEVLSRSDQNKTKSANMLIEQKIEQKVGDWTIVGKLDHYDANELTISDWKITSIWSVKFGEHAEWEQQLNPYAWLLRRCGFEVNKIQICAMLKDWRKSERVKYADYPEIPFKVINVKLWPLHKQEVFIQERIAIYENALNVPVEQLPPCSPKERWAKADVFAVYKNQNKTAARLLDTLGDAEAWAQANIKGKDTYRVDKRPGEDIKCTEFCSVNKFCSYWQGKYGNKP